MDLRLMDAAPSDAERAAVDALLGPPESGWVGGEVRSSTDLRVVRGGRDAREQRHLLLPALHALQAGVGWISRGGLNYVCQRLSVPPAEAYGVATFYAMFSVEERPRERRARLRRPRLPRRRRPQPSVRSWRRTQGRREATRAAGHGSGRPVWGCASRRRPSSRSERGDPRWRSEARREPPWTRSWPPTPRSCVPGASARPRRRTNGAAKVSGSSDAPGSSIPRRSTTTARTGATRRSGRPTRWEPEAVIAAVTDAKLLGRGGAAFPTGVKWKAVADQPVRTRYVICNADESEPGTFKDRVVMEQDPFAVVEALTIAGFACGAERGFVYVRGEYPLATERLEHAIARGAAPRLPRRGRHGQRHGVRHRAPPGRRGLHLRRGDRPVQLDRGQARGAAEQAPVPGDPRRVRQADRDQQRGDADQRPRGAPDRSPRRTRRSGRTARRDPACSASRDRSSGRACTRSSTGPPSGT